MRCRWLVFCLAVVPGCLEPKTRGELPGDTVHVEMATGSLSLDVGQEDEQPTVMFRCEEEGRIGAYLVTGSWDSVPSREQVVRIKLDSAPDC